MSSRFAFYSSADVIANRYNVDTSHIDFYEYYNVKPTNRMTGLVWESDSPKLVRLRWGFVDGKKFFKARAETAHEKKLFGKAMRERRCLIFANGFFEWDKDDKRSIPYYFSLKDEEVFAIAGLYNSFKDEDNQETKYTAAVLTVPANDIVAEIFHRMPAIISRDKETLWLDPNTELTKLKELLQSYPDNEMQSWDVDPLPSRGDNGPSTIEKAKKTASLDDFF